MKHSQKIILSVLGVIVCAVTVAYFVGWFDRSTPPLSFEERMKAQSEKDQKIIKDPNSTDMQIYSALIRRAQLLDVDARLKAEKLLLSKSASLRSAAVAALGFFEDPAAVSLVKQKLKDESFEVRNTAIKGLASRNTPERIQALDELLATKDIGARETISVHESLVRLRRTQDQVNASSAVILNIAKKSQERALKNLAYAKVAEINPAFPELISTFKESLNNKNMGIFSSTAIRHLSGADPQWLAQNAKRLYDAGDSQQKIAILRSFTVSCPNERWNILEHAVLKERDRSVSVSAIEITRLLGGQKAELLFKRAQQDSSLGENDQNAIHKALNEIENTQVSDTCDLRG